MIGMETEQGHKITGGPMNDEPLSDRLQIWLAPYREQCESAFDALTAAFEDNQLVDEFTAVGAHLLVGLGAALGREKEIHPGILEHTRRKPIPEVERASAKSTPDFSGGPMYTFNGSTPADAPDASEWRRADVMTDESRPLYKHRDNRADGPLVGVSDKRFEVYNGATRPVLSADQVIRTGRLK